MIGVLVLPCLSGDLTLLLKVANVSDFVTAIISPFALIVPIILLVLFFETKDFENLQFRHLSVIYLLLLIVGFVGIYNLLGWTFLNGILNRPFNKRVDQPDLYA